MRTVLECGAGKGCVIGYGTMFDCLVRAALGFFSITKFNSVPGCL